MANLSSVTTWDNIKNKPDTFPPSPHALKEIVLWEGRWNITANGVVPTKQNCYGYRNFYLQLESGVLMEGTRHNDGYIRFVYNLDVPYWTTFIIDSSSIICAQTNQNINGLIATKIIAIQ